MPKETKVEEFEAIEIKPSKPSNLSKPKPKP